jgi:hypothetical protein
MLSAVPRYHGTRYKDTAAPGTEASANYRVSPELRPRHDDASVGISSFPLCSRSTRVYAAGRHPSGHGLYFVSNACKHFVNGHGHGHPSGEAYSRGE